ncbi:MAG: glycosyltransferase family 2 protein [Candidatus Melainabacteria bacterium]|jgi:glycosyltransferase involved in cell wall biosynthesis|nr:glycosyltransferase family 2 protein [Candidatus Melainabacteria bacterium]
MKLSIVIPVYNEAATLNQILEAVEAVDLVADLTKEIILVDDCSADKSAEIIEKHIAASKHTTIQYKFVKHLKNSGKGAALQTGFKEATGDFVIVQDADLEYDPEEYNEILPILVNDKADVVYGSRFAGSKPRRSMGFWHYLANKFLTNLTNMLNDIYLTDMETCYKCFKREIIQSIDLQENHFGIEPEMTSKVAKLKGIRIFEVAISYYGRGYEEGKKINWRDGIKAIFYIFKYRFFN